MFGQSNRRDALGFTIVELLVVIVVIGILAAISIVSYTGITKKANEATIQTDLTNASKKIKMYYAEHGVYPASMPTSDGGVTYCPTGPADTNYCIKPSNIGSFNYVTDPDPNIAFTLTATKDTIAYYITKDIQPTSITVSTQPTLPDSDWITIGSQRWARANLNVGTRIAGTTAQTNNATTEKYCYSDAESSCTNFGAFYQWDEAMGYTHTEGAQGICPAGAHIPSDNDWKILEVQLGMTQAQADIGGAWRGTDQGTQLKSGGTSGLNVPLPGYRDTSGAFYVMGDLAYLWSSSESGGDAWRRYLHTLKADVSRSTYSKAYGLSVRCLGN